ncbi:FKBP-type peptidyl-prolyl cis-trans isomerase [Dysgonomonas sp. 520]|uniref:FKBP-type peptidyl-prolyl cis-trans isomerase n=1 Tax=Dysgonomonas sp. 520 TaxID=2302931 RepID=UPI0013D8D685|nr:FKBP-type peptidyl-prolyl cis-trans isomerase [Dysgonomonas sp. 520]NDW08515.1 hypothetical protein [Dysgonomonas sp. 520]
MKKKAYILPILFIGILFATYSCLDDDNDDSGIDEEWKYMNEKAFAELAVEGDNDTDTLYTKLGSIYANNEVYVKWRKSDSITKSDLPKMSPKIDIEGKPQFNDSVRIRYEGWLIDKKGNKIIFDSTENPKTGSTSQPNKLPVGFRVNGVIAGWTTVLQDMVKGEEREVCIPWQLAYGASGNSSIPGYTTLRFRMKLEDIIPMSERK